MHQIKLLADYIHNVFEILRHDLKDDAIKELFLNYSGTWTILKWCKLNNKVRYLIGSIPVISNIFDECK